MNSVRKLLLAATAFSTASVANAATITYNGAGGALPDHVNFTSDIVVGDSFSVTDVNVILNSLTHTYWADLEISLIHGATTVFLTNDNGGSSDPNGTFTFDDSASLTLADLSSNLGGGAFVPLQSLGAFNGAASNGTWTLHIFDDAGLDAGNLVSWSLQLSGAHEGAVPEPGTWAMMLAGFGLVGAAMRRREKTARVRFAF